MPLALDAAVQRAGVSDFLVDFDPRQSLLTELGARRAPTECAPEENAMLEGSCAPPSLKYNPCHRPQNCRHSGERLPHSSVYRALTAEQTVSWVRIRCSPPRSLARFEPRYGSVEKRVFPAEIAPLGVSLASLSSAKLRASGRFRQKVSVADFGGAVQTPSGEVSHRPK